MSLLNVLTQINRYHAKLNLRMAFPQNTVDRWFWDC